MFAYLAESTAIDVDYNISEEATVDNLFEDADTMDTIIVWM